MNVNQNAGDGIQLNSLKVTAGGKILLKNVSANFKAGEISLIVGPSGVGKSILLRIISGLLGRRGDAISYDGTVTVDGKPTRAGAVGVVFQSFALFDEMSPTRNIEFARAGGGSSASENNADQWLDQLRVPKKVPTLSLIHI